MLIVERYHSPLGRSFLVIRKEAPDIDDDYVRLMTGKAINDSIGFDSLVPSLLVIGGIQCFSLKTDQTTPSTFKCALALRKATEAMCGHFDKRQICNAATAENGQSVTEVHNNPLGPPVRVYRPEEDERRGLFSLLDVNGERCVVLLPHPAGPTKFRSTDIKRFVKNVTTIVKTGGSAESIADLSTNFVSTSCN